MNKMVNGTAFTEAANNSTGSGVKTDSYNYLLVDLHDIVATSESTERFLPVLQHVIQSQANLHFAEYQGDLKKLKENIESKGNTFRGFLVYTKNSMPIAYAVYYPMIDSQGRRAAYCEDAHVLESWRNQGMIKIVFQELAKRILEEGCEYLQWTTDKRNKAFQGFADKIGAKHPPVITLVGDSLLTTADLSGNILKKGWAKGSFVTRLIQAQDINMMRTLNIQPRMISGTGDMPFKGFITFKKSDPKTPIAITPGWQHLSTFRVTPGLYLEHPTFADHLSNAEKSQALFSVIQCARETSAEQGMEYLRWHIREDDKGLREVLEKKLKLEKDCMLGPGADESEMIVYTLSNGALNKLKDDAKKNSDQILHISRDASIGPALRPPAPTTLS